VRLRRFSILSARLRAAWHSAKLLIPEVPAAFVPDLRNAHPGTPLTAQVDDIVVWSNATNETHWPWPVDAHGNPLRDNQIPPEYRRSTGSPTASRPTAGSDFAETAAQQNTPYGVDAAEGCENSGGPPARSRSYRQAAAY
jgi:hypothetical protein